MPQAKIDVLSSTIVQPATRPSSPTTTPLSLVDAAVARFAPCGAIWYFPCLPEGMDPLAPDALRKSLAQTLSAYPQWAGQLRMTPYKTGLQRRRNSERYGRMEVRYGWADDPGVVFVVARAECSMDAALPGERGGARACDGMMREDVLVPRGTLAGYASAPEHRDASFAVQVTTFEDGGTAVGLWVAHCLADAISLSRFVHDWSAVHAALASGSPFPELRPVFEPSMLDQRAAKSIDDGEPDADVLKMAYELPLHRYDWWCSAEGSGFGPNAHKAPEVLKDESEARELAGRGSKMPWSTYDVQAAVSHTIIHYTSKQLERIWTVATGGSEAYGNPKASLSRHDALVAHIWTLVNRARGPEKGDVGGEVYCDVTLGLRTRVDPPLPASSLGSPLQIAHTKLPWSVASSAAALPIIASGIKTTLSRFTPAAVGAQIYATAYELAPHRLWQAFLGREHMLVTSWAHTGLYECEFGTGHPPKYVHPIMPLVDGCVQLMEARPPGAATPGMRWYENGVDVAIYLEEEAMTRLVKDEKLWV